MQGLSFIAGGDPVANPVENIKIPVGVYSGFLLRTSGTTPSGKTLELEDFGRYRFVRNGGTFQDADFEFIHALSDLRHGSIETVTGGANALENVSFFLPMSHKGMPNAIDVKDVNELYLALNWNTTTPGLLTEYVSNSVTYELYGILTDLPETYQLQIFESTIILAGAGREVAPISGDNLLSILFKAVGSNVSNVQVKVDNEVVFNGDEGVLYAYTNYGNQVETALTYGEIDLAGGNPINALNESISVVLTTTGADTLNVYTLGLALDPEVTERSVARVARTNVIKVSKQSAIQQAKIRRISQAVSISARSAVRMAR